MGWFSSFMSSAGNVAKSAGSSLSLSDATFGWSDFSSGQSKLKDAYRRAEDYNRSMATWSALNEPSLTKQGLIDAGYNPMLALGNIQSASTGAMPPISGHSAITADPYKSVESKLANKSVESVGADIANKRKEGALIDTQVQRQRLENDILASEVPAVQTENQVREFESGARLSGLQGLDFEGASPAWHIIKDNVIKSLQREGYTGSRAHAIFEDVVPAIKAAATGVGAAYLGTRFGKSMNKLERLTNPEKYVPKLPLRLR